MDYESNYKSKHLKYKMKYIKLKQQQLGGVDCEIRTIQSASDQLKSMEVLKKLRTIELKELKNFSANDKSRIPSYCDRILYRNTFSPDGEYLFKIENEQYGSYANNKIAESDHNLVYAIYNINESIKILIITWNQANLNLPIDNIIDSNFFAQLDPPYANFKSFDIICIGQQESSMYDSIYNIFNTTDSLQQSVIDKYNSSMSEDYVLQYTKIGVPKFYVRQSVLIRKNILQSDQFRIFSHCLKIPMCSKSICGIGFTILINDDPITLNFFNTHMPIDTSDIDMGLKLRISAYKEIDTFIREKFTIGTIGKINQIDFIAGDLNFRYNTGSIAGDQLDYIRLEDKSAFDNFIEPKIKFGPTCKMITCKNSNK